MKKTLTLAAVAATLLLTGCVREIYEQQASEYGENVPVGYLATSLSWEQERDGGTAIHQLTNAVDGVGASFSKGYGTLREAASDAIQLPVGEYDFVSMANMTEADGYVLSGLPPTKAFERTGGIYVSLKDTSAPLEQSWFGVTGASVKQNVVTVAAPVLQRLLPSIMLHLSDVPAGTVMTITLKGVAKRILLTAKDANGHYGLPGEETMDLVLGTVTSDGDKEFLCLPTASNQERSFLIFDVTSPSEPPFTCVCDVPAVSGGTDYKLDLDFHDIESYLYITSQRINDWEEGWTISGEVLNPQESSKK